MADKEKNMTFKKSVQLLIPFIASALAACGLALTLSLLSKSSLAAMPVSATPLRQTLDFPCSFTAITVTANLGTMYRISDTHPGSVANRIIYFANHEPGVITISVAVSNTVPVSCHVWGGTAFGRTGSPRSEFLIGAMDNQRWLTYPVSVTHASATVVLTSSPNITGSLLSPYHRVALAFVQDVTPPRDINLHAPEHTAATIFPISWSAWDEGSGLASYAAVYSSTADPILREWPTDSITLSGTLALGTFSAPITDTTYTFRVTAYDYVGNSAHAQTETFVGPFHIYLPLILRSYPPAPTGNIHIVGRTTNVYHITVTLALSATVNGDTVTQMRIHNEDTNWSQNDWEPYTTTKTWSLADSASGLRTVYAQFRGDRGGVSAPVSTQIYLSRNGDFEDGAGQTAWQETENPLPVSIVQSVPERPSGSTPPADGDYAMLLGNTSYPCAYDGVPIGHAAIEQAFNLPPNVDKLTFKYIIWSQDASTDVIYDRFEVYVNGNLQFYDGNQISTGLNCNNWRRVPGPENPRGGETSGWATGEIDLDAYAGQTVTISFRNYNRYDGWYNTYTYIDNVNIEGNW
jgi:hypothetical protein